MLENPMRIKCLDECTISTPHVCIGQWPWPCLDAELTIQCKDISSERLKLDLQISLSDIAICKAALLEGLSFCGDIILSELCEYKDELIKNKLAAKESFVRVVSKELENRGA